MFPNFISPLLSRSMFLRDQENTPLICGSVSYPGHAPFHFTLKGVSWFRAVKGKSHPRTGGLPRA